MRRKILDKLTSWLKKPDRKPLVIRGARQVGKTWAVRHLASLEKINLLELNFERNPSLSNLFADNEPNKTLIKLELYFGQKIEPKTSLLFLDEIQTAPELLSKLRWFAEDMPELAIICTGSLLDFALDEHTFSIPVGRIQYMYLEPMSFEEFLTANQQNLLCDFLANYNFKDEIPEVIHNKLMHSLREYMIIGGMPAAVNKWTQEKSLLQVNEIQQNILATYQDDFAKYSKRLPVEYLNEIFKGIPLLLGKKFKYSAINKHVRFEPLKKALNLLCKARVCHKVWSSAANGIPIGAEIKKNTFKVIFIDTGLASASMGLTYTNNSTIDELDLINKGNIAEQLVGQLLRTIKPHYIDPELYYWVSEKKGAESEIDYIIQHNTNIIPIEVKAGKTGTLRSLRTFVKQKKLTTAVRFNADKPSITNVKTKDHVGDLIEYKLISLPIYLVEQLERLLQAAEYTS